MEGEVVMGKIGYERYNVVHAQTQTMEFWPQDVI